MIIEVNSLSSYYGAKKRKAFSINPQDTSEESIKNAVAEKTTAPKGHKKDNESFKLILERRLVLHSYDIVEEPKVYED